MENKKVLSIFILFIVSVIPQSLLEAYTVNTHINLYINEVDFYQK